MLINNLDVKLNYENINRDFSTLELSTTFEKKNLLISIVENPIVLNSVSMDFSFGRKLYVAYKKNDPLLLELSHLAKSLGVNISYKDIDDKIKVSLFLNYLAKIKESENYGFRNLNGTLCLFYFKELNEEETHCYEIFIDSFKDGYLPLNIKRMLLKKYNPKTDSKYSTFYKIENNDVFLFDSNKDFGKTKYILKNSRYKKYKNIEIIYKKIIDILNEEFKEYLHAEFMDVQEIPFDNNVAIPDLSQVSTLKFNMISFIDDKYKIDIINTCTYFMKMNNVDYKISNYIDPSCMNIIIMHNKDYYITNKIEEPIVKIPDDAIVKIVTFENIASQGNYYNDAASAIFTEILIEYFFKIKKLLLKNDKLKDDAKFIYYERDSKFNVQTAYELIVKKDLSLKYSLSNNFKDKEYYSYRCYIKNNEYCLNKSGLCPIENVSLKEQKAFKIGNDYFILTSDKYSFPLIIKIETKDDIQPFFDVFSKLSVKLYKYKKNVIQFIPFKILYEILDIQTEK